jgi:hypothetical protein
MDHVELLPVFQHPVYIAPIFVTFVVTGFLKNIEHQKKRTGEADGEPYNVDGGKNPVSPQITIKYFDKIIHAGWFSGI